MTKLGNKPYSTKGEVSYMSELIPDYMVNQIFKLKLPMRLIADNKTVFPIILKSRSPVNNTYTVMIETGKKDIWQYNKLEIELKGRIDIESLKYRGEVRLIPIKNEPGYYKMSHIKLYKVNERRYKRVPYRRAIKLTSPIELEAVLVNISASGAKIECSQKLEDQFLSMEFTLLKKNIALDARIIEQQYDEQSRKYVIRCEFESMDKKTEKIISQAVKEITLMAKERLKS